MSADPASPHGDRRETVCRHLVDQMVSGHLRGGDRLVTSAIATQLGMSATPVREAFAELAGLGLIDLSANRGATVHRFTAEEIRDVLRVRRALECEAVLGACRKMPLDLAKDLRTKQSQLAKQKSPNRSQVTRAMKLDNQLHQAIATHCGNEFLTRELTRLSRVFRSFRDASWIVEQTRGGDTRPTQEAIEHIAILDAIVHRDRRAARRAMHQHITASTKYWSRLAKHQNL